MANINHFDFKNYRVFETEIAGRKLTVETGKMDIFFQMERSMDLVYSFSSIRILHLLP